MVALQYWLDFCHASVEGVCNFFGSVSLTQQTDWCYCPRRDQSHCCSHAFWETNSLRRTMQVVECSLLHHLHQRTKAESPLSQGPQPVFVKTLYTVSVRA